MRLLAEWRFRLRALWRRQQLDADLEEELRDHLAREAAARVAHGTAPAAAQQQAAAAFGGVTRHAEASRDTRGWRWLDDLRVDLRHTLRLARRYPAFSAAVIAVAALGVGATTVVYSAVYGVMLRPLPYPTGERLVEMRLRAGAGSYPGWSADNLGQLGAADAVLAATGLYSSGNLVLFEQGVPENIRAEYFTPSLLSMLGVNPQIGRLFVADDAERDVPVVLLSHGFWRRRFGGDSSVVGRSIMLSDRNYTVLGVMPESFLGPRLSPTELWLPARQGPEGLVSAGTRLRGTMAFGLLRPAVSPAQAAAWFAGNLRVNSRDVLTNDSVTARVELTTLRDLVVLDQGTPLWILLGAVGFILVLVASNVGTLALARASVREHEMAVRQALGAGRGRQVRQIITETLALTLAGGIVGIVLARIGLLLFIHAGVDFLPRTRDIRLDAPVLLVALGVTILAGVMAGLIPALVRPDGRLADTVGGSPGRTGSRHGGKLRATLVTVEVAVSVVLLVGAGLLLKGFLHVVPSSPGFALDHRINMRLAHGPGTGPDTLDHSAFVHELSDRIARLPGVREVAVNSMMPLVRIGSIANLTFEGQPADAKPLRGWQSAITANYFHLMEIPIVSGRAFTVDDRAGSAAVAIVNQTAAAKWWPGQDAVGRHFTYSRLGRPAVLATVVGVARDTRSDGERTRNNTEFFVPFEQWPERFFNVIVHTTGEPQLLAPALKQEVWRLAPRNPVAEVSTLNDIANDSVKGARFYTVLVAIFAAIAIIIAAMGLFSLLAYAVSHRTREIGIRLAVGAPRRSVIRLILGQGLGIAAGGLVIGLVAARLLTKLISSILLEVTPTDTVVFLLAAVALVVVVLAACALPLRRALGVDPVRSLRGE